MITETVQVFKCETCGEKYRSESAAVECESMPVREDKGVKIGDTVRILNGDGAGKMAIVESISVISKDWGHYQWKHYWHTVALSAKIVDDPCHRMLVFDAYEKP